MTVKNPCRSSSRKSSLNLVSSITSTYLIAANEVEVLTSSVYNQNFASALFQDAGDVATRFDCFVEATQRRWKSKATSYTPPGLKRDIEGIRAIRDLLQDHLEIYGGSQASSVDETFEAALAKIQDLLECVAGEPQQPQAFTSASPPLYHRMPPYDSERMPEIYGASDWADDILLSAAQEQMNQNFIVSEDRDSITTPPRGAEMSVDSTPEWISSQAFFSNNDAASNSSLARGDSISIGVMTPGTDPAIIYWQDSPYSFYRRDHVAE